jgi:hypothetical protein
VWYATVMNDLPTLSDATAVGAHDSIPVARGRRLRGTVVATLSAPAGGGEYGFVTTPAEALTLTYEGIPGDRHGGLLRPSGAREPWYPRGTEMRNDRQLSLLAADELAEVAVRLGVPRLMAEWIGGNIVIEGLPHFSFLPSGTRLTFGGSDGAVVVVDAQNGPCRFSGRSIADHYPDRGDIELAFPKVAKRMRGVVGWVERPGIVRPGMEVTARIAEQWIYPSDE